MASDCTKAECKARKAEANGPLATAWKPLCYVVLGREGVCSRLWSVPLPQRFRILPRGRLREFSTIIYHNYLLEA